MEGKEKINVSSLLPNKRTAELGGKLANATRSISPIVSISGGFSVSLVLALFEWTAAQYYFLKTRISCFRRRIFCGGIKYENDGSRVK